MLGEQGRDAAAQEGPGLASVAPCAALQVFGACKAQPLLLLDRTRLRATWDVQWDEGPSPKPLWGSVVP